MKSRVSSILVKTVVLRINLNLDGAPNTFMYSHFEFTNLEHLKIEKSLINEKFTSVMDECEI